jgi:hypothetical protein
MSSRRRCDIWMQFYQLKLILADPPHPPVFRLYHRHGLCVFHPRVPTIPNGKW